MENMTNEEKVFLNGICKGSGEYLKALTKKDVMEALAFARSVSNEEDAMVMDMVNGLMDKVQSLSEEDWNSVKMQIPFPVIQTHEDEVAAVPEDEE